MVIFAWLLYTKNQEALEGFAGCLNGIFLTLAFLFPIFNFTTTVHGDMVLPLIIACGIYALFLSLLSSSIAKKEDNTLFAFVVIGILATMALPHWLDIGLSWILYLVASLGWIGIIIGVIALCACGGGTRKIVAIIYEE